MKFVYSVEIERFINATCIEEFWLDSSVFDKDRNYFINARISGERDPVSLWRAFWKPDYVDTPEKLSKYANQMLDKLISFLCSPDDGCLEW